MNHWTSGLEQPIRVPVGPTDYFRFNSGFPAFFPERKNGRGMGNIKDNAINDTTHELQTFLIEHPHRFATVASG